MSTSASSFKLGIPALLLSLGVAGFLTFQYLGTAEAQGQGNSQRPVTNVPRPEVKKSDREVQPNVPAENLPVKGQAGSGFEYIAPTAPGALWERVGAAISAKFTATTGNVVDMKGAEVKGVANPTAADSAMTKDALEKYVKQELDKLKTPTTP